MLKFATIQSTQCLTQKESSLHTYEYVHTMLCMQDCQAQANSKLAIATYGFSCDNYQDGFVF